MNELGRNAAAALPALQQPTPALKLAVKGLRPGERQLLEGLVKVSQRRTPRLEILDDSLALMRLERKTGLRTCLVGDRIEVRQAA